MASCSHPERHPLRLPPTPSGSPKAKRQPEGITLGKRGSDKQDFTCPVSPLQPDFSDQSLSLHPATSSGSLQAPQTSGLRLPDTWGGHPVGAGSRAERTAALEVGGQVTPAPSPTFTPSSISWNKNSRCLIRMTQESPGGPGPPAVPPPIHPV